MSRSGQQLEICDLDAVPCDVRKYVGRKFLQLPCGLLKRTFRAAGETRSHHRHEQDFGIRRAAAVSVASKLKRSVLAVEVQG